MAMTGETKKLKNELETNLAKPEIVTPSSVERKPTEADYVIG